VTTSPLNLILLGGDQCWRDLTCMNYFYQTQPNPNPLAYYAHQAPEWWHAFETFGNHMIELVFPWCTFIPHRSAWIFNGCWQIIFQMVLISTGNLSFLNWLTVAPSIWYFDDKFLSSFFSNATNLKLSQTLEKNENIKEEKENCETSEISKTRKAVSLIIGLLIAYLSVPIVVNLASPSQAMNRSFDPFRIVNTYGAFGSVTKERTEVIIEATNSEDENDAKAVWHEYEFKCKPGGIFQRPCFISPYHYRLDWLMWFAAFQSYQQNPWLLHLMGKMLENDPIVDSLVSHNPFKGKQPPSKIRARHFKYKFTKLGGKTSSQGHWWQRKLIGDYIPIIDIEILAGVYQQFGWKMKDDK